MLIKLFQGFTLLPMNLRNCVQEDMQSVLFQHLFWKHGFVPVHLIYGTIWACCKFCFFFCTIYSLRNTTWKQETTTTTETKAKNTAPSWTDLHRNTYTHASTISQLPLFTVVLWATIPQLVLQLSIRFHITLFLPIHNNHKLQSLSHSLSQANFWSVSKKKCQNYCNIYVSVNHSICEKQCITLLGFSHCVCVCDCVCY